MSYSYDRRPATVAATKTALHVGDTFENEKWRIHRYANSIHITDLTFAGKRGKKVETFVVMSSSGGVNSLPMESLADQYIMWANRHADASKMKSIIDEDQETFGKAMEFYTHTERGIDVMPGGFQPIKINTDKLYLEVTPRDFTVKDKGDMNNEPTCIPVSKGGIKEIPAFYRWVKDNESHIKEMTFRDIQKVMDNLGVKSHYYCAVD